MRRFIVVVAITLVAAACGSGESSSATFESLDGTSSETMPPKTNETPPPTSEASTETTTPSDGSTTTAPSPAPTELPDSDYPDVVVADLAGGEVNLRELALEAEPVLLWFWAPH